MSNVEITAWLDDMKRLGTPGGVATCAHCQAVTLFLQVPQHEGRKPLTCGRWLCGAKCGEPWAKGYPKTH